jgi:hypothetical protein
MLDFNLTQKEDSIEEFFAKKFDSLSKYPMDNETAEIFIKLNLSKNSSYVISENEKPFIYKVMERRLSAIHTYSVDDRILLFLSYLCKSAGQAVMYCWYIQYKSSQMHKNHFTFEDFSIIFGSGFPSEDGLKKLWEMQKVNVEDVHDSDNLLDYPNAGVSILSNSKQNFSNNMN